MPRWPALATVPSWRVGARGALRGLGREAGRPGDRSPPDAAARLGPDCGAGPRGQTAETGDPVPRERGALDPRPHVATRAETQRQVASGPAPATPPACLRKLGEHVTSRPSRDRSPSEHPQVSPLQAPNLLDAIQTPPGRPLSSCAHNGFLCAAGYAPGPRTGPSVLWSFRTQRHPHTDGAYKYPPREK